MKTSSYVKHSFSTKTRPVAEMQSYLHRNSLVILSRISSQPIVEPLLQNGKRKVTESTAEAKEQSVKERYDLHCKSMKDLDVGTKVAVWNAGSNLWDIYGTITEIGPFRRYRVKTQAGRLLVRNRMFLRRHHSMSSFPGSRNTETDRPNEP